jgi:sulfide dehydrogenase cytochrome subunit
MAGLAFSLAIGVAHAGSHGGGKKAQPELISGASGAMLAATCNGCHGPDGASAGPAIPTISGISPDYFTEVMKGFASGEVPSTIMGRIAKGYSEDEVKRLAEFYSKKPWKPAKQTFDAAMAKEGAKLHEKYCEKCHEDGGKKAEEDAAILAGQWKPYLQFTMADFLSGKREMTKKMKKRVEKLIKAKGEKGLHAILEFYASQQ